MTAAALAQAPRQSLILAAVTMLHIGVFIVVAGDRLPRLPVFEPIPPVIDVRPPPAPDQPLHPAVPDPADYLPETVERPVVHIPQITEDIVPSATGVEAGAGTASSGSAAPGGLYQPPTLDMRDFRLAALVDACYPSSARRLGNQGRAQVNLVIDAAGRHRFRPARFRRGLRRRTPEIPACPSRRPRRRCRGPAGNRLSLELTGGEAADVCYAPVAPVKPARVGACSRFGRPLRWP
jgi:hypothetical protein